MTAKRKPVKSKLQEQADVIRKLKESIEGYEDIEAGLAEDAKKLEDELRIVQHDLADTRAFMQAQRNKLSRECNEAHRLIALSQHANDISVRGICDDRR